MKDCYKVYIALFLLIVLVLSFKVNEGFRENITIQTPILSQALKPIIPNGINQNNVNKAVYILNNGKKCSDLGKHACQYTLANNTNQTMCKWNTSTNKCYGS